MNFIADDLHFLASICFVPFLCPPWVIVILQFVIRKCVAGTVGVCVVFSTLDPIIVGTAKGYADLVFTLGWEIQEAFVIIEERDFAIGGQVPKLARRTVDFRIMEHVLGEFVALEEHLITNNRTRMP